MTTVMFFLCDALFSLPHLPHLTQVFPVPGQVWALCSHPQGDPHRLPLHQPGQGQEDQAHGHGRVVAGAQPQQLVHQLRQFGGLLRGQAQSHRPGERDVRSLAELPYETSGDRSAQTWGRGGVGAGVVRLY